MKRTQSIHAIVFVFLCILLFPISANAADNDTQDEFINSLAPQTSSDVWIKGTGTSETKKEKELVNWNLGSEKSIQQIRKDYYLPQWMVEMDSDILCSDRIKHQFFTSISSADHSLFDCNGEIVYSDELNSFSLSLLENTIISANTHINTEEKVDANSNDSNLKNDDDSQSIDIETEDTLGSIENIVSSISEDVVEGIDVVEAVTLDSIEEGLDIVEGLDDDESIMNLLSLRDVSFAKTEDTEEEYTGLTQDVNEVTTTILTKVGDTKILELSESKEYSQEVKEALGLIVGEGKILEILPEEELEGLELTSAEEKIEEYIFPEVDISLGVDSFIKKVFLSDTKDILFASKIVADETKVSSASLAHSLNEFNLRVKIIEIEGYKMIGFKNSDYYNSAIKELFITFAKSSKSIENRKIIATDISNITFSLSTYTDMNVSSTIQEAFGKKLIMDIQNLEKDYASFVNIEAEEKAEKMSSFLINIAKTKRSEEEKRREEEALKLERIQKALEEKQAAEKKLAEEKEAEAIKQAAEKKLADEKKAAEVKAQLELEQKQEKENKDKNLENELLERLEEKELAESATTNTDSSDDLFDFIMQ